MTNPTLHQIAIDPKFINPAISHLYRTKKKTGENFVHVITLNNFMSCLIFAHMRSDSEKNAI